MRDLTRDKGGGDISGDAGRLSASPTDYAYADCGALEFGVAPKNVSPEPCGNLLSLVINEFDINGWHSAGASKDRSGILSPTRSPGHLILSR